jgi:hypothetical protein
VAYASGGLWRTCDNGISFTPLFDEEASMTIGDIAVDWKHGETIWVGTGENNSSRSSYAGTGIYKSVDTGKTWQYMGLGETQHIGRIIIDPDDSNIAWVAAVGHRIRLMKNAEYIKLLTEVNPGKKHCILTKIPALSILL